MRRWRAARGSALLMALLTVALVMVLVVSAQRRQWQNYEREKAALERVKVSWLLTGALDWARLMVNHGQVAASQKPVDHLSQPWALPLPEMNLSAFLATDGQWREGDEDFRLWGKLDDAQSRLNVMNLVESNRISVEGMRRFRRLFTLLNLPQAELEQFAAKLLASAAGANELAGAAPGAALLPQRLRQLEWLGLSSASLQRLAPFITLLPEATPVNLNTAPAEVLYAALTEIDNLMAHELVLKRRARHWSSLDDVKQDLLRSSQQLDPKYHSVHTRYFEVRGRIRVNDTVQQELALVLRDGRQARLVWRVPESPRAGQEGGRT